MAEDELVELFWESGQLVRRSHTQRPTSDKPSPPPILRGSGSGGGGIENAPLPQPPLPLQPSHQNLFIQEDEMASWLHHPYSEDYFRSDLLYSGVTSTPPQSSVSLAPPPTTQTIRPNFMNFSRLIGRVEAGPSIPVARASTQVDSSATPSSSAITPAHVFPIPGITRKGKAVAVETVCQIVGASSSGTPKAEPEPIQIQPPATETEFADDRKRKEKEETNDEVEKNKQGRGSTSRKRSRAAEMHNIAERRRRGKINEKMKALQQLIPRCNKSDKASTLDDAIEYVKSLQLQIQMLSTGVHPANMAMGMERPPFIPFPRQGHMAGVGPSYPPPRYPLTNIQTSDPSRVHLPTTQHPNPMLNQPQFMGYMNPYSQFHRMQQPPPLQNQTTSQLSSSQATSSKQPEDQENQPTD